MAMIWSRTHGLSAASPPPIATILRPGRERLYATWVPTLLRPRRVAGPAGSAPARPAPWRWHNMLPMRAIPLPYILRLLCSIRPCSLAACPAHMTMGCCPRGRCCC